MKFIHSNKFRRIACCVIILVSVSFGYMEVTGDIFAVEEQRYVAPPSEYETQVNELWQSTHHQAVCKANAAATVSLRLARKYLDESEKQSALSQYDTPLSEVKGLNQ